MLMFAPVRSLQLPDSPRMAQHGASLSLVSSGTHLSISAGERTFIKEGVEQNIRNDGRQRFDYRQFTLKTGVIPQSNGSAELKLDQTRIQVGINVEVDEPDTLTPDEGKVVVGVECAPSASLKFEGYGAQNLNVQLTRTLQAILEQSNTIDKKELCIVPGKQCWVVYIDAVVLDSSGNLLDAIALCMQAAFRVTTIPAVTVIEGEGDQVEIEVSDDPYDDKPFPSERVPVCVSLHKIGSCFVVDPSVEEELCMSSRLTVAVNEKGELCGVHKTGVGGLSAAGLLEMVRSAKQVGVNLIRQLVEQVKQARKDEA